LSHRIIFGILGVGENRTPIDLLIHSRHRGNTNFRGSGIGTRQRKPIGRISSVARSFYQLASLLHRISAEGLSIHSLVRCRISRARSPTISLLRGQDPVECFQAGLKGSEVREHRFEDGSEGGADFINREG
jgi:hypothetical protein